MREDVAEDMAEAVVLQHSADRVHLGLGFEMTGLVITFALYFTESEIN